MWTRRILGAATLAAGLGLAVPAYTDQPGGPAGERGMKRSPLQNEKAFREHTLKHVKYPATKAQLVAACSQLGDIPQRDKDWFVKTLPEGTYNSPQEVFKALGLEQR